MVENEFKVLLTEGQYNKIKAMFAWNKVVEQTNYYYDTAGLSLYARRITCRVRRLDGEHYLQMKLPNGAAYSRIELEERLGSELPEKLEGERLSALSGEIIPDAELLGSLETVRHVKHFGGAEVDLDKSSYFGKTDFEVEIEFTDETAARDILAEIKKAADITDDGVVCAGKLSRFLAEYKKRR